MQAFNPYLADEVATQSDKVNSYFGLIGGSESNKAELHGYEVTMSGRLVLPELRPDFDREEQKLVSVILC